MKATKPIPILLTAILALGTLACEQEAGAQEDSVMAERAFEDIEIIAHRGDSWYTPENTMASVLSAWEKDADAVEIDVYLTADDRVMALHDRTTGRTGDMDLHVNESTSEELLQVDVGSWKSEEFAGERMPFLEDIVASIPAGERRLFIEIKGTGEAVPFIKEIVEESGKRDQVVIIGFELETVVQSKEALPDVPVYWLLSAPQAEDGTREPLPLDVIATANESGLDGLNIDYRGISREFVEECRRQGMGIYVWTVNEIPDLTAMAELGVDGITTDRIDNAQTVLW